MAAVLLRLDLDGVIIPVDQLSRRHGILAAISADDDVVGRAATAISRPAETRVGRGVEVEAHSRVNGLDAINADDIRPSGDAQITTMLSDQGRVLHDQVSCDARPVRHLRRGALGMGSDQEVGMRGRDG